MVLDKAYAPSTYCLPYPTCPPAQVLALLALLSVVLAAPADMEPEVADLDPEDNDSIEQFEEHFHLPKVRPSGIESVFVNLVVFCCVSLVP